MKRDAGSYITKKVANESYRAYMPAFLPPKPPIILEGMFGLFERATWSLTKLNGLAKSIPNVSLFMYMYVRKEALLSSQIEGTQSSFSDLILFEHHQKTEVSIEDVEEVSNYVKAVEYGLQRLRTGFPLSMRLLREVHAVLLAGTRGSNQCPGEFRKSQNWIGGTRPGNALFVPPLVEALSDCLSNLEKFFHDERCPVLLKAALGHVQFETIHPFLDGNGRLGRLLVTLLLLEGGLLDEPILYLSLYLKQNRGTYYSLLQEVRTYGTWEAWVEFFLEGIVNSSQQAIQAAEEMNLLFEGHFSQVQALGRARFSCEKVLEYLKQLPQVSVQVVAKALDMSLPTARTTINYLVELGILEEITGKQRDKVYIYRSYLDILESGAEPISL